MQAGQNKQHSCVGVKIFSSPRMNKIQFYCQVPFQFMTNKDAPTQRLGEKQDQAHINKNKSLFIFSIKIKVINKIV